jgi:hypothetical protein
MQARTLDAELAALHDQVKELRAENARLLRLLELTPRQARPPDPAPDGIFDADPGVVHAGSSPALKVAFFRALFAALFAGTLVLFLLVLSGARTKARSVRAAQAVTPGASRRQMCGGVPRPPGTAS